jgi:hypothetical protein
MPSKAAYDSLIAENRTLRRQLAAAHTKRTITPAPAEEVSRADAIKAARRASRSDDPEVARNGRLALRALGVRACTDPRDQERLDRMNPPARDTKPHLEGTSMVFPTLGGK